MNARRLARLERLVGELPGEEPAAPPDPRRCVARLVAQFREGVALSMVVSVVTSDDGCAWSGLAADLAPVWAAVASGAPGSADALAAASDFLSQWQARGSPTELPPRAADEARRILSELLRLADDHQQRRPERQEHEA